MSPKPKTSSDATPDGPRKSWWKRRRRSHRIAIHLFLFVVALVVLNSTLSRLYDSWDVGGRSWFSRFSGDQWGLQRGAAIVDHPNQFGDQYSSVRYLWQGWSPAESLWFYTTTQGSDLLPYDFFMELQDPATGKLFRSDDSLYSYGYLLQKATRHNPDALPIGFVKDTYIGKDYLGFTCAACHTGQVNYKGVAMRIDGAPAGSDLDSMLEKLAEVMRATLSDKTALAAFEKRVIDRGHYSSAAAVEAEMENSTRELTMYVVVNRSHRTRYGYYRLDALGRTFNRVLEHVIAQDQLNAAMEDLVQEGKLTQDQLNALRQDKKTSILTGEQRDHLVFRLSQVLPPKAQLELRKKLFIAADAPVSYPFLWDVPQHDYLQWNGIVQNAGLGPLGRNAGEAIAVFSTLDWSQQPGISLASVISGQGFKGPHIDYKSSVNVHNLRRIEHQLQTLQSPKWPGDILPAIDQGRVYKGKVLFSQFCAACHATIDSTSADRRVVAQMTSLKNVGTDPTAAMNAVTYDGLSGILRNQYVSSGAGPILIDQRAPIAALFTKVTLSVVATPSPNKNFIRRGLDWADDLITSFLDNDIKPSIKRGNYDPDTTADPYASLRAYKARSLNGIWATAPYLHNGSVPTLYDLLLPKKGTKGPKDPPDPPDAEYRPDKFMVGSHEFDPDKVGLKSSGYDGFLFNTALPGNSNAGHEYGTKDIQLDNGKTVKALTREQRLDLLEYLKTL
jgi:mono/diheme cytochrome c family protein